MCSSIYKTTGGGIFIVLGTQKTQNPLDQLNVCAKAKEGSGGLTCIWPAKQMPRVKSRTHANTKNASTSFLRLCERDKESHTLSGQMAVTYEDKFSIKSSLPMVFSFYSWHLLRGNKHLDDEDAYKDEGGTTNVVFKTWHLYSPVLRESNIHTWISIYFFIFFNMRTVHCVWNNKNPSQFFFLNNLDIQVNPTIKYQPAFPGLF